MLPERWRAALPVVAAVAVVAALSLVTVTVMSSFGDDGDDRAFVDADSSTTTTTEATTRRTAPRPTTTTTRPAPEVLGETTERQPGTDPVPAPGAPSGGQPGPTPAPAPGPGPAPAPAVQPGPAPTQPPAPTPTSPPTTVCRNSTNPSCGELRWDPQPGPYSVEVFTVSAPGGATVGEPVTFAVDYIDPAGPAANGACLNWRVSDPGVVNTSSCNAVPTSCERTGPHDPPRRSRDRIALEHTIVFQTPGEHVVRIEGNIATHLPDGCESPYRNTFTRTFTIVVD